MTESTDKSGRRQFHPLSVLVVGVLCLLLSYVLSIGPAYWCYVKIPLSGETRLAIDTAYDPIWHLDQTSAKPLLYWYSELWTGQSTRY
jgi:hypothetical protein